MGIFEVRFGRFLNVMLKGFIFKKFIEGFLSREVIWLYENFRKSIDKRE